MNSKPYKIKVSISLDDTVVSEIREMAENDDRSFSQYINLVLKERIRKNSQIPSEQEKKQEKRQ